MNFLFQLLAPSGARLVACAFRVKPALSIGRLNGSVEQLHDHAYDAIHVRLGVAEQVLQERPKLRIYLTFIRILPA